MEDILHQEIQFLEQQLQEVKSLHESSSSKHELLEKERCLVKLSLKQLSETEKKLRSLKDQLKRKRHLLQLTPGLHLLPECCRSLLSELKMEFTETDSSGIFLWIGETPHSYDTDINGLFPCPDPTTFEPVHTGETPEDIYWYDNNWVSRLDLDPKFKSHNGKDMLKFKFSEWNQACREPTKLLSLRETEEEVGHASLDLFEHFFQEVEPKLGYTVVRENYGDGGTVYATSKMKLLLVRV